jgi:spore coat protein U-like protein
MTSAKLFAPCLIAAIVMHTFPTFAATDTANFQVSITILGECEIVSASDLVFGSHADLSAEVDADSAISVECTPGTGYWLRLNEGAGTGATVAERLMTRVGGTTISYSLYTDAGRNTVWGDTPSVDAVAGTGTGSPQVYPVYGRVPIQALPLAGTFTDTITVTVEF